MAGWTEVLAVFAVKTTLYDGADAATATPKKKSKPSLAR